MTTLIGVYRGVTCCWTGWSTICSFSCHCSLCVLIYIAGVATGEVLLVVASYSQLDFAGAAADSKPPFEHNASSLIPYFFQFETNLLPNLSPQICILASLQHMTKPTIAKPIYYYYILNTSSLFYVVTSCLAKHWNFNYLFLLHQMQEVVRVSFH